MIGRGDLVKVLAHGTLVGSTGIVTEINPGDPFPLYVCLTDGRRFAFKGSELELLGKAGTY